MRENSDTVDEITPLKEEITRLRDKADRLAADLSEAGDVLRLMQLSPQKVRQRISVIIDACEGIDDEIEPIVGDGYHARELRRVRGMLYNALTEAGSTQQRVDELVGLLRQIDRLQDVHPMRGDG